MCPPQILNQIGLEMFGSESGITGESNPGPQDWHPSTILSELNGLRQSCKQVIQSFGDFCYSWAELIDPDHLIIILYDQLGLLAGLEKTRFFFNKTQPGGVFWVLLGFWGFIGFFWVFLNLDMLSLHINFS